MGLCKSVWVGNVNAEIVTEAQLQQIFSQCGKIESVKVLPTRYCAFINYLTPEAAVSAITVLQVILRCEHMKRDNFHCLHQIV